MASLSSFNASEVSSIGGALQADAGKYENKQDVEFQWAVKAYHHAETYFNLISSVDPRYLKLTQLDDEIYTLFRQEFPDFNVEILDEDKMKSPAAKEKWRGFCNKFQNRVEDFNMGTLIRKNSHEEFSESNSTLVVRIQFLAIEIARNREGFNDGLNKKTKETS
ncbi:protein PBDC1-like [Mercenaria mercenaria]|uniref:protein PBDC1-like n=1 Tax=Mercenaria mercenaria TaxID=6596 RepID=UPI00234F9905|nr:protein PBDC1-like [Mercenaria mercenaria]XP_053407093.1 protein PBDC1-like [Mercenaria mercenaria]XP_053407094.1 protein PBDC1-like [Mercenaria mercenaria]